jgi:hypothetical protein
VARDRARRPATKACFFALALDLDLNYSSDHVGSAQRIMFDAIQLALQCVLGASLKITETARPFDWAKFSQS